MAILPEHYGATNGVQGLYNVPNDGQQFGNNCDIIWDAGCRTIKMYCTADYLTDYPLQTSWSSVPTTITELAQTAQFTTQLTRGWDTIIFTVFTFASGSTNSWRINQTAARMDNEYNEIYDFVVHLLTTYNNTGKTFIIQNWEGDWAFGDSFDPATFINRKYVDYYSMFLGTRQKAVSDARAATPHTNVKVLHAIECNRVTDSIQFKNRRRIDRDIAERVQPDVISYSCYDSTIVEFGYGSSFAEWEANCQAYFGQALRVLRKQFPNSIIQIGEVGFPENEILISNGGVGYDVGDMLEVVRDVAQTHDVSIYLLWQSTDNSPAPSLPEGVRGFWMVKQDGSVTAQGAKMAVFAAGG